MALRENNAQVFLILLGISFLLFFPILNNEFWTAEEYEYLASSLQEAPDSEIRIFTADVHPLVRSFQRIEYKLFGDIPTGYYLLNILLHAVNAFLLFLLILLTVRDFGIAFLSALLFVFTVGNYGKEVMYAAGVSSILLKTVFLMTVMGYVANETRARGKIFSWAFLGTLVLFTVSMISVQTSMSIAGVLFFYNVFFRKERGRAILAPPLVILLLLGFLIIFVQRDFLDHMTQHYPGGWGAGFFLGNTLGNIPRFLIHMVFPIHFTELVREGTLTAMIFDMRGWIRPLAGLIVFSYAAYGFVFGNTNLRFFIAWTFVTILPFCLFYFPGDWLNIKYLYLPSAGFCLILSTGTMKMIRVLQGRGWRQWIPAIIPALFILLAVSIVNRLDTAYELRAQSPQIKAMKFQYLQMKRENLSRRGQENPQK